jgi:menaquinone-dependent protoporphyrinogen oxidase
MKVLVAYRSKYGFTEGCAKMLAERIRGEVELLELRQRKLVSLAPFDVVLLGGSIYGGAIQREVSAFCNRQREALLERPVGLFLCCLYEGEKAQAQMQEVFPGWLLAHAIGSYHLGGGFEIEKLRFLDRFMAKRVVGLNQSRSVINERSIDELCERVNQLKSP